MERKFGRGKEESRTVRVWDQISRGFGRRIVGLYGMEDSTEKLYLHRTRYSLSTKKATRHPIQGGGHISTQNPSALVAGGLQYAGSPPFLQL